MSNTLGSRLKAARLRAGLSQTAAGAVVGVSKSHMSKIESDGDRPSVDVILQLAKLYGVPVRDLDGGELEITDREVALNEREVQWLQAFRDMDEAEQAGALAFLRRR